MITKQSTISTNTMASARAIQDMDEKTQAAALADIQDDAQLEAALKALQLKAEARRHTDEEEEVNEAAVSSRSSSRGGDEPPLPEELWNPHWQSNLKLLQVRVMRCR